MRSKVIRNRHAHMNMNINMSHIMNININRAKKQRHIWNSWAFAVSNQLLQVNRGKPPVFLCRQQQQQL